MCCAGVAGAQDNGGEYYAFLFSSNYCYSCEKVDMFVFTNITQSYPELVVIDYELSGHSVNAVVNRNFSERFNVSQDVPKIILDDNLTLKGMNVIISEVGPLLEKLLNETPPASGSLMAFKTLDISALEGYPKLWRANRVLIFEEEGADTAFLKELINTPNINKTLSDRQYETISPPPVRVGKQELTFDHAVRVDGWILQWNGDPLAEPTAAVVTQSPLPAWLALVALGAVFPGYGRVKR